MKTHFVVLVTLAFVLAVSAVSIAGSGEPKHYFGPGPGYPDLGDKYFYNHHPPEEWGTYGYGTGHMSLGYGPYVYGK
jgi:hypothetical protein